MGVKIFVGLSDEELHAKLAKQKASWERSEDAADGLRKSVEKAERAAINYGKNVVKQNRTAEQALKDRIAAVELAAKKEEITEEQKKHTIQQLIQKYKEAGRAAADAAHKGTDAYKEQRQQIDAGKRKVEELRRANQSLNSQYREIRTNIRAAFRAGEISADQYRTALRQLKAEQDKAIGGGFKQKALEAAATIGPIATAWRVAQEAVTFYADEKERAMGQSNSLENIRRSLRQISKGDFDSLESRADALTGYGIDRVKARELVFAARSTGFEGEEATVAKADPVIKIDDGAAFAGEFRKFFAGDKLSIEQAFNTALAGAAESQFNISELLPQVRTAAQGALAGGESSDVVAATSVLADNFGRSTGDRLRALGVKLATNSQTKGLNLIEGVEKLIDNPALRGDIVKDSSELQAVMAKFEERLATIKAADARIEQEQKKVGAEGLLGKAVAEAVDISTASGRIELARRKAVAAEQRQAVDEERRVSQEGFNAKEVRADMAVEVGNKDVLTRAGSDFGGRAASKVSSNEAIIGAGSGFGRALFTGFGGAPSASGAMRAIQETRDKQAGDQLAEMKRQTEILEGIANQAKQGPLSKPSEDR